MSPQRNRSRRREPLSNSSFEALRTLLDRNGGVKVPLSNSSFETLLEQDGGFAQYFNQALRGLKTSCAI